VRLVFCALAVSCGGASTLQPGGGQLDFNINGIAFHVSSGAAVSSSALTLYLTDQPDTCLALRNAKNGNPPVGIYTRLALRVAAAADGTTRANVVSSSTPGPGQAAGGLTRMQGGQQTASVDAANGSVTWTLDAKGNATLVSIDAGFAGTADRLAASGLSLPACSL
jgi:hypothetical protein